MAETSIDRSAEQGLAERQKVKRRVGPVPVVAALAVVVTGALWLAPRVLPQAEPARGPQATAAAAQAWARCPESLKDAPLALVLWADRSGDLTRELEALEAAGKGLPFPTVVLWQQREASATPSGGTQEARARYALFQEGHAILAAEADSAEEVRSVREMLPSLAEVCDRGRRLQDHAAGCAPTQRCKAPGSGE